jgi:hypothetical protein
MLHEPDQKSGLEKTQDGTAALLNDQTPATPFSSAPVHSISSLSFPLRTVTGSTVTTTNTKMKENKQTNDTNTETQTTPRQ